VGGGGYWGYPGENRVFERVYDGVMSEVQQPRSADGEPSGDPQPWLFGPGPGATPRVQELDDDALIGFTVHSQRSRSRMEAQEYAAYAELARRKIAGTSPLSLPRPGKAPYLESRADAHDRAVTWAASEFAPPLRLSPITMKNKVDEAMTLVHDLPRVWQALADGRITGTKARFMVKELTKLDPQLAAEVAARLAAGRRALHTRAATDRG